MIKAILLVDPMCYHQTLVSTDTTTIDPISFLDKIAKLYPFGIPQACILSTGSHISSSAGVACLCIVVLRNSATHDESTKMLISGISSKGLKLGEGEYAVEEVTESDWSPELLQKVVERHQPRAVIVFGGPVQPGVVHMQGRTSVLYSYPLERIAGEISIKRDFWGHLQESIVPLLGGR